MADETFSPLIISLEVAGLATVLTFFVGIGLAYGCVSAAISRRPLPML